MEGQLMSRLFIMEKMLLEPIEDTKEKEMNQALEVQM